MYEIDQRAIDSLKSNATYTATLVTINVDSDTVYRWTDGDVAWQKDGHAYSSASPLISITKSSQRTKRQVIQVHIEDNDKTYANTIRAGGVIGMPIEIIGNVVVGDSTLIPVYTFAGVTSGLIETPTKEGRQKSNTVIVSSGKTVRPGMVLVRYASHEYQKNNFGGDTIFRRIHSNTNFTWSV